VKTIHKQRVVGVIPARYRSSRFPGKPLADLCGHPLVYYAYQQACKVAELDQVVVATDDERIAEVVRAFGGEVVMTSPDHPTGSDRVAEAARLLDADLVVDIQGDEPMLDPVMIRQVLEPVLSDPGVKVTTLMGPVQDAAEILDPNVVKLVTDLAGHVLCFSRSPIPFPKVRKAYGTLKQFGLYAFRREALERFTLWSPGPLEITEGIELLRFLEHGYPVHGVETSLETVSVDTLEDLDRVRLMMKTAEATPRA